MRNSFIVLITLGLIACGGPQRGDSGKSDADLGKSDADPGKSDADSVEPDEDGQGEGAAADDGKKKRKTSDAGTFQVNKADKSSRPKHATKIKATKTESAVRFFVVDKKKGPMKGIVISLTSPAGKKYYTEETDEEGYAEVLLPIGQTYDLVYLSLGRSRDVSAKVKVADKPNLNLKLTMRYNREEYAKGAVIMDEPTEDEPEPEPRFVLKGVEFDSGKAKLKSNSFARLDTVVEYMTYKKSARIEISGHTDNVGKKKTNKKLSQRRAEACRDYLVSKGIDKSRIEAVGYGDAKPIASNDTPDGRQKNRRIEATEL